LWCPDTNAKRRTPKNPQPQGKHNNTLLVFLKIREHHLQEHWLSLHMQVYKHIWHAFQANLLDLCDVAQVTRDYYDLRLRVQVSKQEILGYFDQLLAKSE